MTHVRTALALASLLAAAAPVRADETVTILALYTPAARDSQGGKEGIEALIDLAIAQTNEAFANSQVGVQVQLVFVGELAYHEKSPDALLEALEPDNGELDEVQELRDAFCADVVSVWAELVGICGAAPIEIVYDPSPANEGYAFHIVDPDCQFKYTFTHELGHDFGCGHDAGNGEGAFPWAHGHVGSDFRTVMAYGVDSATPRILYFSNPAVAWEGEPTGTADANNASVVQQTAPVLAAFRSGDALACWAGPDQVISVPGGTKPVTLSGFASKCGEAVAASYEWFVDGVPVGQGPEIVHEFGIGTWQVTLVVATQGAAPETVEDSATIELVVNQPPVAVIAASPVLVDLAGFGGAIDLVSGSGSFDPDGDPLVAFDWWIDGDLEAFGVSTLLLYLPGVHELELRVRDVHGAEGVAKVQVIVKGPIQVPADQPTLQAAVDAALPGDVIVVSPGIYKGPGNRDVSIDKPLTILSVAGAEETILDCELQPGTSGFRAVLPPGDGLYNTLWIEGFTIQGASEGTAEGGGIAIDATLDGKATVVVANNRIRRNKAPTGGGVSVRGGAWVWIASNRIEGNWASAGGGIHVADAAKVVIRNCLVARNVAGPGGGGGLLVAGATSPVEIENVTFAQNTSTAGPSAVSCSGTSLAIVNSIVWDNKGPAGSLAIGGDAVVTFSDVQGGWAGLGNIDADPIFLGPATGDWRLAPTSPCVDAANGFVAPGSDAEGHPRYDDPDVANSGIGPAADLGAYEYQGTLEIVVGNVPPAVLGATWSLEIVAAGGQGPGFEWLPAQGLPPGLALVSDGGPTATIAGVPTKKGSYPVTVQVVDSAGAVAVRTFWIYVF